MASPPYVVETTLEFTECHPSVVIVVGNQTKLNSCKRKQLRMRLTTGVTTMQPMARGGSMVTEVLQAISRLRLLLNTRIFHEHQRIPLLYLHG